MIRQFIKKERGLFTWFLISISIILIRLALLKFQEIFYFGAEIGNISVSLATGFIITYVFYYVVVFRKSQVDNKNVSGYFIKYLSCLVIDAYRSFHALRLNSHVKSLPFPPTEDELVNVFKKLDPVNSFCQRSQGGRYNWYDYLKFVLVETSNEYIKEIWNLLPYLDSELLHIINSLKESHMFHAAWGISREVIPSDPTYINIHNDRSIPKRFAEYFKIIQELEIYLGNNFSEYTELASQRKNELNRT
jgi:hypothetical protein